MRNVMRKIIKIISGFVFTATLILLLAFQYNVEQNEISLTGEDLCAQTGSCKHSPPDNCYVNGEKDPNKEWVSGEVD